MRLYPSLSQPRIILLIEMRLEGSSRLGAGGLEGSLNCKV